MVVGILAVVPGSAAGQWDPRFRPFERYEMSSGPAGIAVGDVTSDGRNEVLATGRDPDTDEPRLYVFHQQLGGTLGPPETIPIGAEPGRPAVGDLNGDGANDVAIATEEGVSVHYQDGGELADGQQVADLAPVGTDVEIADMNGDGRNDIVTARDSVNRLSVVILTGQEGGGFSYSLVSTAEIDQVEVGDVNADGLLDVVAWNVVGDDDEIVALLHRPTGEYTARHHPLDHRLHSVGVADFTADGREDLTYSPWNLEPPRLAVIPQTEGGELSRDRFEHDAGPTPTALGARDMNGDDRRDIALLHRSDQAGLYLQTAGGSLAEERLVTAPNTDGQVELGDVDCDGRPDMVIDGAGEVVVVRQESPLPPPLECPPPTAEDEPRRGGPTPAPPPAPPGGTTSDSGGQTDDGGATDGDTTGSDSTGSSSAGSGSTGSSGTGSSGTGSSTTGSAGSGTTGSGTTTGDGTDPGSGTTGGSPAADGPPLWPPPPFPGEARGVGFAIDVEARARQRALAARGLRLTLECDDPCAYAAAGALRVAGSRRPLRLGVAAGVLPANRERALRLRVPRATRSAVRTALRRGRRVTAAVAVVAENAAGIERSEQLAVRVTG